MYWEWVRLKDIHTKKETSQSAWQVKGAGHELTHEEIH